MSEHPTEGLLGVDLTSVGTQLQTAADAPVQTDRIAEAIRAHEQRNSTRKDYANPGVLMQPLPDSVVPPTHGRDRQLAEVPSEPGDVAPTELPAEQTAPEGAEAGAEITLEITEDPEVISGDEPVHQDQPHFG